MDGHADALSRAERHRLRDIERGLAQDDPDFAAEFDDIEAPGDTGRFPKRMIIGLFALGVLGVASLTAGLVVAMPIVGLAGFAIVVLVMSRLVQVEGMVHRFRTLIGIDKEEPEPPA